MLAPLLAALFLVLAGCATYGDESLVDRPADWPPLTQAQLAKQLGVTVSTVAKWEQAVHPIPPLASKLLRTITRPR